MKEQNNNEKKNELGKNIKRLRKQRNMSQEELAQKLFISRTAISKWESGTTEANIEFLMKMAAIFNVDLDQLITQNNNVMIEEDTKQNKEKEIRPKKVVKQEKKVFHFSKANYTGFSNNSMDKKDSLMKKLGYVFGLIIFTGGFYLTIIVLAIWGNVPDVHNIYIGQIIAGIPLMIIGIVLFVYTLKNDLYYGLIKRKQMINSSIDIEGDKISISSSSNIVTLNKKDITLVKTYYEKLPKKLWAHKSISPLVINLYFDRESISLYELTGYHEIKTWIEGGEHE